MDYTEAPTAIRADRKLESYSNGNLYLTNYESNAISVSLNSRSGSSNPNYRNQIAARVDATGSFSVSKTRVKQQDGEIYLSWTYQPNGDNVDAGRYVGALINPVLPGLPSPSLLARVDDQATTKFLSGLYRARTSFSGGVFLGELKEAISAVRSPLQSLRSSLSRYVDRTSRLRKRRGRNSIKDLNKAIAGTYLESVFGWMPLASDIDDACKALANNLNYRSPVGHFSTGAESSEVAHGSGKNIFFAFAGIDYHLVTEFQHSVRYTCGFTQASDAGSIATDFGVGLRNFVPTCWELLPWSFVADYFVNIGEFLEGSLASSNGCIYCSKGSKTTSTIFAVQDFAWKNISDGYPWKLHRWTSNLGSFSISSTQVNRGKVFVQDLSPSFRVYFPGLFSKKSLNLAALFAQGRRVQSLLT